MRLPSVEQVRGRVSRHLDAADEDAFRALLFERTGMDLRDHQLANLSATAAAACERFGFANAGEYLESIVGAKASSPEMEYLVAGVTIGETYFFRDSKQLAFLKERWLPAVVAAKRLEGSRSLRIWSAGCSSGEELVTLAILLRDGLPDHREWTLHLLGTDINTESLARAVRGRYREWAFRATSPEIRQRYFAAEEGEFAVHPELRSMLKFDYLNLIDDTYPCISGGTSALDLIVCRNVFIYFGVEHILAVLEKFSSCLVPGGSLLLGSCDPLHHKVAKLTPECEGSVSFFRSDVARGEATPASGSPEASGASDLGAPLSIAARSSGAASGTFGPDPERRQAGAARPVRDSTRAESIENGRGADDEPRIRALVRAERWMDVVSAVNACADEVAESAVMLRFKARALASLGELEIASELCVRAVAVDPYDKDGHFIHALVLSELERPADAEVSLRKAICLDSRFLEAHRHLGLLRLRQGKRKAGLRSLRSALELANSAPPEDEVEAIPGMTYARLAEVLAKEIEMYRVDVAGSAS